MVDARLLASAAAHRASRNVCYADTVLLGADGVDVPPRHPGSEHCQEIKNEEGWVAQVGFEKSKDGRSGDGEYGARSRDTGGDRVGFGGGLRVEERDKGYVHDAVTGYYCVGFTPGHSRPRGERLSPLLSTV